MLRRLHPETLLHGAGASGILVPAPNNIRCMCILHRVSTQSRLPSLRIPVVRQHLQIQWSSVIVVMMTFTRRRYCQLLLHRTEMGTTMCCMYAVDHSMNLTCGYTMNGEMKSFMA